MNRKVFAILLSIAIGFNLWSCSMSTKTDMQAEKEKIREAIDASIGWADTKDTAKLYGALAQDASFFIYHPDSASTVVGFEKFKAMVEGLFLSDAFKATGYDIRDLRINLSTSGDVAWYAAILDDRGEFNGRAYAWLNTRWTGVLEKRNDRWVIVQMHFSFASDAKADEKESEG
jgi:ketosteroid isomerase-like protein